MSTKPNIKPSKETAPSKGTLMGEAARAVCNTHSRAQREAGVNRAMSLIYASASSPHAASTGRR